MRNFNLPQSVILALFLFVNTLSFSNTFNKSVTINKELRGLFAPIITSYSPTSGTAGTEVTIIGSGFSNASVVTIGITPIAIVFVSTTELKIIIPCGLTSGDLIVDGTTFGLFNYNAPTITTILPNLSYCVGATVPDINLAGTPSGTTFNWTNSNTSIGIVASGTGTSIPSFTAVNLTLEPITSSIIVAPIINGCLGEPKNYTITVNPLPVVTPISNISVCAGVNINQISLSASSPTTVSGTTFSWIGTNNVAIGLSALSGTTSPIPAFTAANPTNGLLTSTFTVTPTYESCIGNPVNFTIEVAPQSVGGVLSGAASICSGSTSGLLSLNGYEGAILNWESSTSGGAPWTSIANTASAYESASLTQTTYFRVAVQNSGCAIVYSNTILITVNSSPSITGNLPICVGSTTTLIGSANAATSNAWKSSNTGIASISNTGLVSGIYPGTSVITYTNSNGCSTTINFVVNGSPTLLITNPGPICPPNTINLTLGSVTAGSTPSLNYSYFTDSSATNSLASPNTIAISGTFYIKGTDSNGCSTVNQVSTVINSLPTITISGAENPICTNNSVTLTASGANTYSWNSGLGSNASVNVTPLTTTTYSVNATDNNGCVGTATATVTVKPLPTVSAGVDRTVCLGQSIVLSGSGTAGTNYTWNNAITNSVSFTPSVTTLYTVTGKGLNECFNSDSVLVTVNALPTVPTLKAIQPNCSVDKGTVQFSGLPTFGWTINPGSYNGTGSTYLLNNQLPGTYNFSVTDINLCTSLNSSITINTAPIIPTIPAVGIIIQPSCSNPTGSVALSGLPTGSWTITKMPGGETYTNTGNTYTVTNLATGTYTFSVSNGTCSSLSSSNVVIDAVPTQLAPTVGTIIHPTCSTATGSVTLNGLPTGNWTIKRVSDGVQFSGSVGSTTISNLSSGTYYYTVTNANGCTSISSNSILINSQPASPPTPIAYAQSFLASDNATVLNLKISGSGTPIWYSNAVTLTAIPSSTPLATGTYYASQTSNGCESISRTAVPVSIFSTLVGGSVSGTTSVCSGTNATLLTLSGFTGSIIKWQSSTVSDFTANVTDINIQSATYTATNLSAPLYFRAVVLSGTTSYSSPAFIDVVAKSIGGILSSSTAVCLLQNSGLLSVSGYIGTIIRWEQSVNNGATWIPISNITDTYTSGALLVTTKYRVVVQNGVCPEVYSSVATITVNSTPTITDILNQNVCYGTTVSFGNPVATPGYTYEWSSLLGISPNPTTPDYSFTVTQSDTYTHTIKNTATGCSISDSFTITMKPLPIATVIGDSSICEGNTIAIGANSTVGSTYSWTSNLSGFTSTNSNPSVTPAVTTTYFLEETILASGCKNSNQVIVTVQPIPVITIAGSPQYHICETTTETQIQSSAVNYIPTSVVWSKVIGSGNFDFTNILNPKYSPSTADIALGSVKLRLTVTGNGPCAQSYSQDLEIIIDKKPIADASLDVTTCGTNQIQINATGTLYATNLLWTLPSGITGTLDQSNPYIPIFTPSLNDVNYAGPIVISLEASSNTTCPSSTNTVSVLIPPTPIVDAGPPTATICEGSNYIVPNNSATVQNINNATLLWTKGTGDGTIVDPNSLTPKYIPGSNDIANGSVTLTLSAAGNSPCNTTTTDSFILTIVKKPFVNVGPDTLVCEGPININATILNADSILWTSNGNGNFVDPTVISPIYNPALSDLNNSITFTATVKPKNNCGPDVIDSVIYRINAAPSIIAGGNDTICQSNATYQLQATTNNTTSITWTSTGSGSFDNIHNEDPIYSLSPNDILVGSITFKITGTQSGCADDFDEMVLTIQKNPIANAGLAQIICQGDSLIIPGSATYSSTYNWIRNGGIGTFINANTTNPTYISQPTESGIIDLTLIADPIAPCTVSANSDTTITIVPKATADAGSDGQICEGDTFQITSAGATNNVGVQWSTNGDGTFTGGSTIDPIYTPGPSDKSNGSVVLTLIATKNFPCNANAEDQMTLIINKIPTITVINPNVDLCVGDPSYIVTGVVPTNYDTLSWSTSGSGTFAPDNTVIAPTYFPSASDYTLGTITLTLTAAKNPLNCNSSTSNTITLHFISPPIADAGPITATICELSSYVTNGTTATDNYSNVTWSTTGTGTFTNATTLLATYTPSAADYNLGFVDLTLMANPLSPCTDPATDVIRLNLQKLPIITLTATDSICVTQNSYGIGGTTVTNYAPNSFVWTTSGTGTFLPSGDPLNPIYNPSNTDLALGSVTLTLTVNSIAPCIIPVSSTLVLSFQKLPVANAGPNITRCALPFQITDSTVDLTTISNLVWSTSGTGTFDFTNIINPIYTPSAADILSGSVRLTLTANPIAPCAGPLVTYTDVTLINSPLITVVSPQPTVCYDITNVLVNGTGVQYATSYNWTSATGTTISNSTSLTPLVTPSLTDIVNGYIDLTITAVPNPPCSVSATKIVRIPIQKKPYVFSGASQSICEGSVITTSDALSTNVTNLHWTNNGGDGTFTTSNLNTITEYTPGPNEIATGKVLLNLTGDAIAPCIGTVTAPVEHLITKNPVITVNPTQVTICETGTYQVPLSQITVVNASSINTIQWTTTNANSLTGSTTFTPTYTPSAADITAGFANLVLTVTPKVPCATPIVKTIRVNITKKATIDATQTNYTFCENTPKQLNAVFNNHNPATISWAIVSGSGTLSGINTATPIYTPDASSTTVIIEVSISSNSPCTAVETKQFTLNVIKKPIVIFAATTDIICNTQTSYALNGNTVTNVTSNTTYLWTTTGTGTFANNTALVTTYNFSAADLLLNSVTLRLVAQSDVLCVLTDFEEIIITIKPAPIVTTTPNETICKGTVFTANATATNENTVLWSTVGASNGLFANANQLVTQYTPGTNDINSITIQVTATGYAPCAAVSASKTVAIQQNPTIDAGIENRYNCSGQPYQITGVTGKNLGAVSWTSNSGAPGTFSDPTALNPSYTPSASELTSGTIILTVTAQAVAPCTNAVSDFIVLNLTPNQVVAAGIYPSICEGASVSLIGNATNSISVNWTSSGTGTFSAINSLNNNYVPSNSDIINGTVKLTLHAISDSNCPEVTDSTVITILKKPTANAGENVSICQGSSYTLSAGEASAQNYNTITWTATGPGALSLSTINSLTPTYVPAVGQTGTVTLTLTATGYAACGIDEVSTKTITIVPQPFSTIPSTKTICEGNTLTISSSEASAINYSSLLWTSSNGLGTFSSKNTAATIYTPAPGQTGLVTLSLTATSPNGVCPSAVGTLLLDIIAKPIVEAGTNGTICQSGTYTVTGASVQNQLIYLWSVSGPAIIQSGTENTLNPVIVPNTGATGTVKVTLTAVGNGDCPVVITDFLTIQINPIPVVNAGTDGTLCEGTASYQLNGTVVNANSYTWTTTGGGIIQQTANPLMPLYVPSASDYATSTGVKVVTINLNATTTNGCSAVADTMQLTLYAKPKLNAGIDLLACQDNSSVLLNGATVSNYNSNYTVSWNSSGNGTFDYTNSNGGINPVYVFGTNEPSSVTLTISVLPNGICPQVPVTDSMVITIHQSPTIVASSNLISMCGETFTMPDLVTVNNSNSILWTNTTGVSGTPGVLTNATTETPIFTPSANEIVNGFALLTLTALPQSGCSAAAVTDIKVNLRPKAIVNAGDNITACQGEIITFNNGASVQNYTTYSWSENGTGTIDPATINTLNPKYYPGTNETGVITFTLQATDLLPCAGLDSQTMTVTISSQPTVNAGPDVIICQNTNYTLATATVANNETVLWFSSQNSNGTSSGTYVGGTFSSTTIINPTYTPSQDDINLGYVYLTVRANSSLCSSLVSDVIKITISKNVTVVAGSDATICEGMNFSLAGASQSNATTLVWTNSQNSNGTSSPTYVSGSFNSTSILNPIYTPSLDDIIQGHVYLKLTGVSNSTCPANSSIIRLDIIKKPTVSGNDVQMCINSPQVVLNGTASNYQSINWSIQSGPGSLITNSSSPLNPTFITGLPLNELSSKTTIVRLYVEPKLGCQSSTAYYKDITINIQALPTVEAGLSGSTCYTAGTPIEPFTINGTSVTNSSSQNWTSSGVGIFTVGTPVLYQSLSNSCTSEILTLTANGIGVCSASTSSDSVTLKVNCAILSLGTITSNSPTTICQGATASYSIPANSNVQSYTWSVPSGATIQSGQNTNTIQVLYSSIASSGNVTVTATNACESVISTLPITINTLPTGTTISGTQSVCAGATNIVYTATSIANALSYEWTLPNGSLIITAGNTIPISFGLTDVSGNLTVVGKNSCGLGVASVALPITIVPKPIFISDTTPDAICSGSIFNYTPDSSTMGATYSWTRAVQSGLLNGASSGSGNINETLINNSSMPIDVVYQYTILGSAPNYCSNLASVIVRVNPIPSLTSGTPLTAICSNGTFSYAPTSDSLGDIKWTRATIPGISQTGASGIITSINTTISETLTNTTLSPITVTYKITLTANSSGCAKIIDLPVVVNPLPIATIAGTTILCRNNASPTITFTGSNGIAPYTFTYKIDSGTNQTVTTTSGNSATLNVPTTSAGSFVYTLISVLDSSSSTCSQLQTGSATITVNSTPLLVVNSPAAVCSPNTVNLTTLTTGSDSGLSFTYWKDSLATLSYESPTIATAGLYYIKATNDTNGCFDIKSATVSVNPLPNASISGTSTVCQNGTQPIITFTGSNGTAPYTFSYQINGGPILNITSLASSNTSSVAIPTTTVVNYTITLLSVQDSGAALCSSSNITLPNSAFVEVQQVGTIIPQNASTVSQTLCEKISINKIVFDIGGSATNSYAIGLPSGLVQSYNPLSNTFTISGISSATGTFNYTVHTSGSVNGCDTTYNGTLIIKADDSITLLTPTTDNQNICSGGTIQPITYSLGGGATGGIVTFSPSQPIGITWSVTSNILTIQGTSTSPGTTYTYTVQSFGICSQSTATGTITIKNSATITLLSGNPSPSMCQGSSFLTPIQFGISPSSGTMIVSSGALLNGVTFNPITGILTGTPSQSGTFPYTITSDNGCGNTLSGIITVNPLQSISYVSGNINQVACQNSLIDPIILLTSTGVNSVTVSPTLPAGISTVYNPVSNIVTISGTPTSVTSLAQNYTITTQGTCGLQATYNVTFNIRPEATITFTAGSGPINQAVCQSSAIIPITFTVGGGATGIVPPTPSSLGGLTFTQDPSTGIYTVSGNPSVNGIFNFPITTTGCPKTLFITISNVNSSVGITLTSAVGTDNQTLCQTNFNSPITPIIYTVIGASSLVVNGLPIGVTYLFSPTTGQLIISGTPFHAGIFNYTITSSPCSVVKVGIISISSPISVTGKVTPITCGGNDGKIEVTILGGTPFIDTSGNSNYAITWTGPNEFMQNQTTITGLSSGDYKLKVVDAIGCTSPDVTYTIAPSSSINVSLKSKTSMSCNGTLGCANFSITGGTGIYTSFLLQYFDPFSQVWKTIIPNNNNYFNICGLKAGLYSLIATDSNNCKNALSEFIIDDNSLLSIKSITLDTQLCTNTPGKITVEVNNLDSNPTFFYNSVLVSSIALGNNAYELSINNPKTSGILTVKSQSCSVSSIVTTATLIPDFGFTSYEFRNYTYFSVNSSIEFTNLFDASKIPQDSRIVWSFGDNTPSKVFYYSKDKDPNSDGESFKTVFHTYTTSGIFEVTLTLFNSSGCSKSITKSITIGSGNTIMIPTAFSPNDDGYNDFFRPSLIGFKEVSIYIYDNWSNLVYEGNSDAQLRTKEDWGWNGIEKGSTEPKNGTYRYYIMAKTIDNKIIQKKGEFLLIK